MIVILVLALVVGASFLTSHNLGGESSTTSSSLTTSSGLFIASSYSHSSPSSLSTSSSITTSTTSSTSLSSYHGTASYSPSCFALYSEAVHVSGAISPTKSDNVGSVRLYWNYHGQNKWTWLNDLTYGPSFSSDGNFSHMWNPPEAAHYDFEANWTLSNGQVITGITSQSFQVVTHGSSCP